LGFLAGGVIFPLMRLTVLFLSPFLLTACVTTPETGRKAFIVTSEAEETQLGTQAFAEVLQKEKLSGNAKWNASLQKVGKKIASVAGKPGYQWEFRLIESKEANAFCLPGGKVAFYTGIFPYLKNEAGLAAVMGHEIAHATARHAGQRITTALGTQLGVAALGSILGGKDAQSRDLLLGALGLGFQVGVSLPFSRSNEAEADEIGLKYMAKAGYDPRQAPEFWSRFAKAGGGAPPEFLSTHPASGTRQEALQAQLPQVLPLYERSDRLGAGEAL
jgi:metalloendopeptidase OMA1, mitochondrial